MTKVVKSLFLRGEYKEFVGDLQTMGGIKAQIINLPVSLFDSVFNRLI